MYLDISFKIPIVAREMRHHFRHAHNVSKTKRQNDGLSCVVNRNGVVNQSNLKIRIKFDTYIFSDLKK